MKTYDEIRNICDRNGRISERVVDNFLLNYAAGHRGLEKKMEQQFARFSHVGQQLGKQAVGKANLRFAAALNLNRYAARIVADPAGEAQLGRQPIDERPKTHPLNLAGYDQTFSLNLVLHCREEPSLSRSCAEP